MQSYSIFVAEVASTCNEELLFDYLLKTTGRSTTKNLLIKSMVRWLPWYSIPSNDVCRI